MRVYKEFNPGGDEGEIGIEAFTSKIEENQVSSSEEARSVVKSSHSYNSYTRSYVIICIPRAHQVTKRTTKWETRGQWNCFPERRLNRNQTRFRDLVWNGRRGAGVSLRTDDWEFERCRVEPFPPFFFEFTWFIWREGGNRERQRGGSFRRGDGGGITRTLCLIMINFAIHAGGPLSRTGFPVTRKKARPWGHISVRNLRG